MRPLIKTSLIFGLLISGLFSQEVNKDLGYDPIPPTVSDTAGPDGWVVLLDGTNETMSRLWWISDRRHGSGGKWWYAPDPSLTSLTFPSEYKPGDPVMWSDQESGGEGGILQTHRRYKDVEFKIWCLPGWGNDGGIFLRTNESSAAWQIVIDYENGSRVAELYDEGTGHPGSDRVQSYNLRNNGTSIEPADRFSPKTWGEVWDPNGLNLFWTRVTGRPVHLESKVNGTDFLDFTGTTNAPNLTSDGMGYIGLQIHRGAGSWEGGPNKYGFAYVNELITGTNTPMHPVITTSPSDETAPGGTPVTFTVAADRNNVSYQWQKLVAGNWVDIAGATNASFTIQSVSAGDATSYSAIVVDNTQDRVSRSELAELTVTTSLSMDPNLVHKLNANWVQTENLLNVSAIFVSDQKMIITDIRGQVQYSVQTGIGKFDKQFPLSSDGVYFISFEGNAFFKPLKVSKVM